MFDRIAPLLPCVNFYQFTLSLQRWAPGFEVMADADELAGTEGQAPVTERTVRALFFFVWLMLYVVPVVITFNYTAVPVAYVQSTRRDTAVVLHSCTVVDSTPPETTYLLHRDINICTCTAVDIARAPPRDFPLRNTIKTVRVENFRYGVYFNDRIQPHRLHTSRWSRFVCGSYQQHQWLSLNIRDDCCHRVSTVSYVRTGVHVLRKPLFFPVLYQVNSCISRTTTLIHSPRVSNDELSKNEDSRSSRLFLYLIFLFGKDSKWWPIIKMICDYVMQQLRKPVQGCSRHDIQNFYRGELLRKIIPGTITIQLVLPGNISSGRSCKFSRFFFALNAFIFLASR